MKPPVRNRLLALALWAAVGLGPSCGARSGLDPGLLDSTISPAVPCKAGLFSLRKANPTLLFVIDRSRSMLSDFGGAGQSRWEVLRLALSRALPPVDDTMDIGALLFPAPGSSGMSCSVSSAPNLRPSVGHVAPLLALLAANPPGGSTPTADAIATAARSLQGTRAASTARALVLATDGAPDCNTALSPQTCVCAQGNNCQASRCLDDTRTVGRIASAAATGLPTYVIGIQDGATSPLAAVLDTMADAGQRPQKGQSHRYYAVSSEAELAAALVTIRDQVGACTYLTSSVPDPRGTIRVTLDGLELPFDPSGETGWNWADRNNGEILLSAAECSSASVSGAQLSAELGCSLAGDGGDGA
jgi:hypothetical protein